MAPHPLGPSLPDLVFLTLAALLTASAGTALTQSDGDLFAHLRMGAVILASGQVPQASVLGVTSVGVPAVAPAWLAEVGLALVQRHAGLGGVALVAALAIAATHAIVAALLRRAALPLLWVVAGTAVSILLGATHWLARPHLATLLGAAALVGLLESPGPRRWLYTVPLLALWANLHAGFVYGLALLGAYAAGDLWDAWRTRPNPAAWTRATWRGLTAIAGVAATALTPYGVTLHRAVWRALRDPAVAAAMDEARPPSFHASGDRLFLLIVLGVIAWAVSGRLPRLRTASRLVIVLSVGAGLVAGRHIALFAVTGWPLLVRAVAPRGFGMVLPGLARREARARVGGWSLAGAVVLATLGWTRGASAPFAVAEDGARFPTHAVEWLRQGPVGAADVVRVFTPWTWGGYLVYAWPGARAFVDPLAFGAADLAAYERILGGRPGWERELDGWGITMVLVPTRGAVAERMRQAIAWALVYSDGTATVFVRRNASTAATVPAGSSSCGTCPSVSNITTRLPGMSRANRAASVGGISRSRPPQRMSVGRRSPRRARVSAGEPVAEKRARSAARFPSRRARS